MTFFGKTMLVVLVVMMAASGSAMATVYQVGDLAGWTFNYNYNEWAFFKQFQAGDTLVFNYDPQLHNVMQVDINDYNSCISSNPLATFNSGSDSITLDTPDGDYFFICGIPGHCASGLKIHIKVSPTTTTTTPPPPPTTMNNRYPDHFPTNQTKKPYSSASTTAYSLNMLFTLFLLPMV
ncbi:mavicyanin-like [Solanum stenotomum]|uniref:mavicyanin-like n=1 Tax=Solanum stenotomum TaxID=172797 RepID=UPI0020D0FAC4|nr:mavicyanin-like [Solanum stenotomum]